MLKTYLRLSFNSLKRMACHSHFFRYLQIRQFVKKTFTSFPAKPSKSLVDCIFLLNPDSRGLISQIYEFINNITPDAMGKVKEAWDSDLGVALKVDQWNSILDLVHTSSKSAKNGVCRGSF